MIPFEFRCRRLRVFAVVAGIALSQNSLLAKEQKVIIRTRDDQTTEARIIAIDATELSFSRGNQTDQLAIHAVDQMTFEANSDFQIARDSITPPDQTPTYGKPARPYADTENAFLLMLTNKDVIYATNAYFTDDETVVATHSTLGKLIIPIGYLDRLYFGGQTDRVALSPADNDNDDVLVLRNGDQLSGEFLAMSEDETTLLTELGEIAISHVRSRELLLNRSLAEQIGNVADHWRLTLRDGTSVTATDLTLTNQTLNFRPLFQPSTSRKCSVRLQTVMRMDNVPSNERKVVLTDAISVEHADYFGTPQNDLDLLISNQPVFLSTQSQQYRHGFQLRGGTAITFAVPKQAVQFQVDFGFQDQSTSVGDVEVAVEIEGQQPWSRQIRHSEYSTTHCSINGLDSGNKLTISVSFGRLADIGDLINVLRPRFLIATVQNSD